MKTKQLVMNVFKGKKGGRRPNSGRKRIHSKGVAHRRREKVSIKTPLHINFKYRTTIKNKQNLKLLKRAIMNARSHGLKIIHFSMQSNHVHLIIESTDNTILSRGMRSLTVTFAKGLNKGRIQIARYHLHVLRTVRETKNAVNYVIFNKQKHEKGTYSTIDQYCSVHSLKEKGKLIGNFAKKSKMTLRISTAELWVADLISSYLLKRATQILIT